MALVAAVCCLGYVKNLIDCLVELCDLCRLHVEFYASIDLLFSLLSVSVFLIILILMLVLNLVICL